MSRAAALTIPLIAVTGLAAEARIAAGSGITTLPGGGDAARLALMLQAHLEQGARAVISFGIAGGLAAGYPPGTVVVARTVVTDDDRWPADPDWHRALTAALPQAVPGNLLGVDAAVAGAPAKALLRARSGAVAVDMESHVAARLAARYGLPFAALRVISDPAERGLPQAALVGMRPDGGTDIGAVLRALARHPADLPGLIRTALDAQAAFRALKISREAAGDLFRFAHNPVATSPLAEDEDQPQPAAPFALSAPGGDRA